MNQIKRTNQFIKSQDYKKEGRNSYYKMLDEVRNGNLIRIRQGVYATFEQLANVMIDLDTVIPNGILCHLSACNIHGLTMSLPQAFHVAIKRGRKIVLPEYPPIELHSVSASVFELGLERKDIDGYIINIYNKERCVCDAIKYRNKVGIEVCSEVVNTYLKSPERNLTLLMDYARELRVVSILKRYMEIVL